MTSKILFFIAAFSIALGSCTKNVTSSSNTNSGPNNNGNNNNNNSSISEVDSTVYITTFNYNFSSVVIYSLNAHTGNINWETSIPYQKGGDDIPPFISINGNVIYNSINATLYAMDVNTGTTIWTFKDKNNQPLGAPVINGSKIYLGSSSGTTGSFYELDASSGNVIWQIALPAVFNLYPVYYNQKIFLHTSIGLLALNTNDGSQLFLSKTNTGSYPGQGGAPLIINNSVYISAMARFIISPGVISEDTLFAIDANAGNKKWVYPFSLKAQSYFVYGQSNLKDGNTIYNVRDSIIGIDATTGNLVSEVLATGLGNLTISGNNIYASMGYAENFTSYNAQTNGVNWTSSVVANQAGGNTSEPTVSNGTIYLFGEPGVNSLFYNLFAIDSASGTTKWSFLLPGPFTSQSGNVENSPVIITNKGNVHSSATNILVY
jgi:outer membrane protein assembly factor BamB